MSRLQPASAENNPVHQNASPATPECATEEDQEAQKLLESLRKDLDVFAVSYEFKSSQTCMVELQRVLEKWIGNPRNSKSLSESISRSDGASLAKRQKTEEQDESNTGGENAHIEVEEQESQANRHSVKNSGETGDGRFRETTLNDIEEWKIEESKVPDEEVQEMVRLWKEIMNQEVVCMANQPTRLLPTREAKRDTFPQSIEPDSQETEASSHNSDDSNLMFKRHITMKQALHLIETRRKGKNGREEYLNLLKELCHNHDKETTQFEIKITQVVVNRCITCVLDLLKEFVGRTKKLQQGTTLHYYSKRDHGYEQMLDRRPDSLLCLMGKGGDERLNKEKQTIGALVSFEHKAKLDVSNNKKSWKEAMCEITRDAAEKTNASHFYEPAVTYSIITDGIEWQFHRLCWKRSKEDCFIATRKHAKVILCNEKTENKESNFNFTALAKWILFILQQSLCAPKEESGFHFHVQLDKKDYKIIECIRKGAHSRPQVFRVAECERGEQKSTAVLKLIYVTRSPLDVAHKDELKKVRRMVREIQNLKKLADVSSVVNMRDFRDDDITRSWVLMEDAGVALDKLIVSGAAGKHLAKVVFKHIWEDACKALSEQAICFADIHPGNICVDMRYEKATLVDLESATEFQEQLDQSPIFLRTESRKNQPACSRWDKAAVAAILKCLWDDGSFDKLKTHAESMWDETNRESIIRQVEQALKVVAHSS